jgi:hypothetical protein
MTFLRDGGEALLERLYFYGKFLLVAEIYFTVFFLTQRIYFGNIFRNHKNVLESR